MPKRLVYDHNDRFYADVGAYGDAQSDIVVPDGKTWEVVRFLGNGAYLDDTAAELWWDKGGSEEILLAATHGDADILIEHQVTGNGARKLTILLTNDTSSAHVLGARWDANEV
jgi:hypothetical protein